MIIVMKKEATKKEVSQMEQMLVEHGLSVQINEGTQCTVLGALGDTACVDQEQLSMRPGVEKIMRVQEPFKQANRKFHPDDTVVQIGNASAGGKELLVIAGPCSVESEDQMAMIGNAVRASGAGMLRGGAYKPRSSPYSFQGLEKMGLEILTHARTATGLPIISEIISPKHVEMFEMVVDVIQIGARNMQNFDLLKEVGRTKKPILLKRGLSSTIEEWLMSAEYILAQGNPNVILCERGIRTFENYTRNTLDLSAVPAVKALSHLPVVVDPSHGTGKNFLVESMSMAAIAAGADGLIVEVHNDPANALSDGPQSLTPAQFEHLMQKVSGVAALLGRSVPNRTTLAASKEEAAV